MIVRGYARAMEDPAQPEAAEAQHVERGRARWRWVWLPLLLLPMWVQPPDFGSVFLWLAGGVVALISAWRLLRTWVLQLVARLRGRAAPALDPVRLVRQSVTLAIVAGAIVVLNQERASVRAEALALAQAIQAACDADGICPPTPADWALRDDDSGRDQVGRLMRFLLFYRRLDEGQRFELTVRWALDDAEVHEGGVGLELVVEHRID